MEAECEFADELKNDTERPDLKHSKN